MDLGLEGRRALVSGGTRGIGRAIVETLAAEGAAVGFCARTERDVADAAGTLSGNGSTVLGQAFDVADEQAVQRWVAGGVLRLRDEPRRRRRADPRRPVLTRPCAARARKGQG